MSTRVELMTSIQKKMLRYVTIRLKWKSAFKPVFHFNRIVTYRSIFFCVEVISSTLPLRKQRNTLRFGIRYDWSGKLALCWQRSVGFSSSIYCIMFPWRRLRHKSWQQFTHTKHWTALHLRRTLQQRAWFTNFYFAYLFSWSSSCSSLW
jgi:hypothetical protein